MVIKNKVIRLRKTGKTYLEINKILDTKIPKSTISYWCKNIKLSPKNLIRIKRIKLENLEKSRLKALSVKLDMRNSYLKYIKNKNKKLIDVLNSKENAQVILSVLYEAEGGSVNRGSLMFGNSKPEIIKLFLKLLRICYKVDESKFRCTLQARADQNISQLKQFWSKLTKIPLSQFYKTRIDPRTVGKISTKKNYQGVCRIDYFSAKILIELKTIADIIYEGL